MDYKEKYEQALERAKYYHDRDNIQFLENIFPELKESEDERIRKEIISHFNETIDNIRSEEIVPHDAKVLIGKMQKWIVWLEKQAEQKPNFCHHEVDLSGCSEEYCKAYYDGWNNCNMQHSQCRSELDDVVKCLINGMKFYYEDNEEATWGTGKWSMPVKHIIEVLERQGENGANGNEREIPNSSWSEEDEKTINNICHIIRQYDKISKKENQPCWYIGDCLLWMQNIKNKVIPQPKREWSEEDENRMKKVMHILSLDGRISNTELQSIYDWLKSLKPQSQWKPSKEQINALDFAVDCIVPDEFCFKRKELKGLLEQLKKLIREK